MPQRRSHIAESAAQSALAEALAAVRAPFDTPFPPEAVAEAERATAIAPDVDLRDVPFATLDPEGSRDLDQAFQLERAGRGFTVRYAIADVPGFVTPGGALDAAARERGQTLYAADGSIPLHPPVLSEGSASLLPDQDRPALVWTFALDAEGVVTETTLQRALIRSRAQLDYVTAQQALDRGEDSPAALLPEIGRLRLEQEAARGGASLNLPDAEVVRTGPGQYGIERRQPLPVEDWNAQLSLMTGMAAADIMLDGGVGVLRTMPQPDEETFEEFRTQTQALGRPWTTGRYGEYLRGLDRADPLTLPVLEAASALFRGAGYVVFDGTPPEERMQAAIGAPYAHATAPLRRLVDRWSLAICLALSRGEEVPAWAREGLAELPELMQESSSRASQLNAQTVECVEAALLAPRVGEVFEATVIRPANGEGKATVQIAEPAVTARAPIPAEARPGAVVRVRLDAADIRTGAVAFSTAGPR
ncbi:MULTISPECIES: RNB domain-containing ribonuclease [unclassified Microbacterium]|uniref:RNB domain-containing ribonuclease n=1 Tax=unclassified Microbacterium TaxID=2609290 RepID=UPI0012FA008E|nr:RNB domain-containing ribonuclease [Microbacterium sp. MAH-37]MVQ42142.1 RNB domain-containing ribonuclease [Microbacterium sp. MAH-37]